MIPGMQRILIGKDKIGPNPCPWFQGDQVRKGVTSTRGYQALLPRREFQLQRGVDIFTKLPDRVRMSNSMSTFKVRLDEILGYQHQKKLDVL